MMMMIVLLTLATLELGVSIPTSPVTTRMHAQLTHVILMTDVFMKLLIVMTTMPVQMIAATKM